MKMGEYRGLKFFVTETGKDCRSYVLIDGEAKQCQVGVERNKHIAHEQAITYIDNYRGPDYIAPISEEDKEWLRRRDAASAGGNNG